MPPDETSEANQSDCSRNASGALRYAAPLVAIWQMRRSGVLSLKPFRLIESNGPSPSELAPIHVPGSGFRRGLRSDPLSGCLPGVEKVPRLQEAGFAPLNPLRDFTEHIDVVCHELAHVHVPSPRLGTE